MTRAFIAYPATPAEIGDVMRRAQAQAQIDHPALTITTWQRPDLGGYSIIQPIIDQIVNCDLFAADITKFNFNVTYELGYAIGLGKRVIPIVNSAFPFDQISSQKIGIYDTMIRQPYNGCSDIISILADAAPGQRIATNFPPDPLPLYTILPAHKIDEYAQLVTRARKAGLHSRTFDPNETPRLAATEAVRAVAASYGVVVPNLPPEMVDSEAHNIRAAFVAGVADALEKPLLLLRKGDWAAPSEIVDQISSFNSEQNLGSTFTAFAERVHDIKYAAQPASITSRAGLATLNLGEPAAENEESQLINYFLDRGEFQEVFDGRANIVVGRKGSGKTAVCLRARDYLRGDRSKIVLHLSPEAYQLKKLKDVVLNYLNKGSEVRTLCCPPSGNTCCYWKYVPLSWIGTRSYTKEITFFSSHTSGCWDTSAQNLSHKGWIFRIGFQS